MTPPRLGRPTAVGLCLLVATAAGAAQSAPFNASLVGHFNDPSSDYADVWGDGDIAYVAHYGQARVDIVDVSSPASPQLLSTYHLPAPDDTSSAQDVKVADGLLFVISEASGSNGVHIVDVRNPSLPALLTTVDPEPGVFETSHNCAYDAGWLYVASQFDTRVAIIDLRSYDPDAAPAAIGAWTYGLDVPGAQFIHDITVANGLLFCSGWANLTVYDVSNLGAQAPVPLGSVEGLSNHAVWPSEDGQFFVTSDERAGGSLRLYEIIDLGASVEIVQRDSYQASASDSFSVHNPIFLGDRVYASWYQAGARVLQVDRTTKTWQVVATYDTTALSPTNFSGAWGVHPLIGLDRVLVSDIENGLFVVDMSAVQIAFEAARPETVEVGASAPILVSIANLGNAAANTGTATLMASVNGAAYQAIPLLPVGGGLYEADLPPMNCNSTVDYYVAVEDLSGKVWTNPAAAPAETYSTWSSGAVPALVFSDDFQTNKGWSVANTSVTAGGWARANPSGTGAQPQGGDPDTAGALCYVTGPAGGSIGADDLDGGPATLTSPVLDFSAGDGVVRYKRWFFNDRGDGDTLSVQVSNNNGSSWTTVEDVARQAAGGWVQRSFRVSDHVSPTAQVRVRFVVADQPNNTVTEAAIDTFVAQRFDCASAALAIPRNGIGLNPDVFATSLPILGMDWTGTIATASIPGASLTYWLAFSAPFDPGLLLSQGELLIDITAGELIAHPAPPAAGVATHVLPIPPNVQFQGLAVYNQGVVFAPGSVTLTNAVDAQLDY